MRPLKIYNIPGQETRTLVDKVLSAGSHNLVWDGKGGSRNQVATGISLCRIQNGDFSVAPKMSLIP